MLVFASVFQSSVSADEGSQPSDPSNAANISTEEFISSPFADFFKSGDYVMALQAIKNLAQKYPQDPLIKRYHALVLERLGRFDEALAIYDELIAQDPMHVPTRFFRAQAYFHKGENEKAIQEFQWVEQNSTSKEYVDWTKDFLKRLGAKVETRPEIKRFYLFGNEGWEYDSNVRLQTNDEELSDDLDQNAGRFALNLGLGYILLQESDTRLDVIYTARQSFNDDSLEEFNFTSQELALDGRKRVSMWDHDVTLSSRYEFRAGFLDRDLFSLNNWLRLSADTKLTPHTRSYLYQSFMASDFGPDGEDPQLTSRDGFYYDLGLTQYFYSSDFRSYFFIGEEFELAQTRGDNFIRRGTSTRLGLHVPVPFTSKLDLDTSAGFNWGEYPDFQSLDPDLEPNQRLDNNWDLYTALTYRIRPRTSLRLFYRYVNANNENDFYQYDRHIGGLQLLFTQHF
jgi:tetratricopeptide (TPR) repeat protein